MMLLGRYSTLVLDSWTRPKYARLTGKKKVADSTIIRRFRGYRPYAGLAFWLFLTRDWVPDPAEETPARLSAGEPRLGRCQEFVRKPREGLVRRAAGYFPSMRRKSLILVALAISPAAALAAPSPTSVSIAAQPMVVTYGSEIRLSGMVTPAKAVKVQVSSQACMNRRPAAPLIGDVQRTGRVERIRHAYLPDCLSGEGEGRGTAPP